MNAEPGYSGWASDVELDLLLLNAKASTVNALDLALDMGAGLAAIRAQHERGAASRPPHAPGRSQPARRQITTDLLITTATSAATNLATNRKDFRHERHHPPAPWDEATRDGMPVE